MSKPARYNLTAQLMSAINEEAGKKKLDARFGERDGIVPDSISGRRTGPRRAGGTTLPSDD
jgi:hypothetical protein